jgi:hypothetical protein
MHFRISITTHMDTKGEEDEDFEDAINLGRQLAAALSNGQTHWELTQVIDDDGIFIYQDPQA